MEQSFETPAPIELYVENLRGRVDVTAADTTVTTVQVTGERADEFVVEHDGHQVAVIAPKRAGGVFGRDSSAEVVVTMPARSTLVAKVGSSDLTAHGPLGDASVDSGSGDVSLELVEGDAELRSGSGDLQVTELRGDARVKSGSGDVVVKHSARSLVVSTGSGDVLVRRSDGHLAVKTGSGDVLVGEAADDISCTTGSGDLRVDVARRGKVTVKGASGDVLLGVPRGTPVWTDITTASGRVSSEVGGAGEPAEGQDFLEVRARTASGDITLQSR
ncbi:MAG: hypothetical protein AVDCRST_MAG32-207 [uncultured Nocardioides sp.]|uniref:DUF4097 domain-containing protein n=1 Tax=uncultured Nocardioides sp. TaxID=198441 RepID=A0A6J4MUZ9_9ACTN|nr:MAG: hypothetical protein AVDCRST_MAG32-207 [uncultured Nocardioides sp.]